VPGSVRVAHPFHPQRGQEIDVVVRRHQWGEDRIFYRNGAGHMASLPAGWTSAVPEDPRVAAGSGRSRFLVEDLIELAAVVSGLRR
jgi:hypothetical protein